MSNVDTQKRMLITAAKVVQKFGEIYLPILERAEQEYERALNQSNAKDRASQILKRLQSA